jgi:hypothetical protein
MNVIRKHPRARIPNPSDSIRYLGLAQGTVSLTTHIILQSSIPLKTKIEAQKKPSVSKRLAATILIVLVVTVIIFYTSQKQFNLFSRVGKDIKA